MKGLQRASDGTAEILKFSDQEDAINNEAPDLNDVPTVHEETVVAKEEQPMPQMLPEIARKSVSAKKY